MCASESPCTSSKKKKKRKENLKYAESLPRKSMFNKRRNKEDSIALAREFRGDFKSDFSSRLDLKSRRRPEGRDAGFHGGPRLELVEQFERDAQFALPRRQAG